jgi:hypothetical protein
MMQYVGLDLPEYRFTILLEDFTNAFTGAADDEIVEVYKGLPQPVGKLAPDG